MADRKTMLKHVKQAKETAIKSLEEELEAHYQESMKNMPQYLIAYMRPDFQSEIDLLATKYNDLIKELKSVVAFALYGDENAMVNSIYGYGTIFEGRPLPDLEYALRTDKWAYSLDDYKATTDGFKLSRKIYETIERIEEEFSALTGNIKSMTTPEMQTFLESLGFDFSSKSDSCKETSLLAPVNLDFIKMYAK